MIRTMEPSRILHGAEHLAHAVAMDPAEIARIADLAAQLQGCAVLPVVGAGASFDCGVRLAGEIGPELLDIYNNDPTFAPPLPGVSDALPDVTEAMHLNADQVAIVRALGLDDPALWPGMDDVSDHVCGYRAFARLAREGFVDEAVGFNYDCGKEAGFKAEGFLRSAGTRSGRAWRDHIRVVADGQQNTALNDRGTFTLFKAHGCAERYREVAVTDERRAADAIVITRSQLEHWRDDSWMRDVFRDRVRKHVLLLVGFSGQDAVIAGETKIVLQEVFAVDPPDNGPRVVAIDPRPNQVALQSLIRAGIGGQTANPAWVTQIDSSSATTTAAALILLAEMLALELGPQLTTAGYALSADIEPRLASLIVSGPAMLRWSYILIEPSEFIQDVNLQQVAERGYVPLTANAGVTARAFVTRRDLRAALAPPAEETIVDAMSDDGFIVAGGCAYMPVGICHDRLIAACRPGGAIDGAKSSLPHPAHLEIVLVSTGAGGLRGVSADTGAEVSVP